MAKNLGDLTKIFRRVTGRNDPVDLATSVVRDYINDFYLLSAPQDIKTFDRFSFLEFNTTASQEEYIEGTDFNLQATGTVTYNNLHPPAWVNNIEVNWYQDPETFFRLNTIDSTAADSGVPAQILYYDKRLTMRPIPDDVYTVQIAAYEVPATLDTASENIRWDYWYRYLAYGAAIDFLSDFGEIDKVSEILPMFERYRALVASRTSAQLKGMRSKPSF